MKNFSHHKSHGNFGTDPDPDLRIFRTIKVTKILVRIYIRIWIS
jgi:hypothetical protein